MGKACYNLRNRKGDSRDECYTMIETVEAEVFTYPPSVWENKHVLCPCDAHWSVFTKFFTENFEKLKLRKLTCSSITDGKMMEIAHADDEQAWNDLEGDMFCQAGDFRSFEVKEKMKECDIVVTNPPFSLSIPFLAQIVNLNKKYLFIDHQARLNCRSYFKEFYRGNLVLGNTPKGYDRVPFRLHETYELKEGGGYIDENGDKIVGLPTVWVTNLPVQPKSLPKNDVENVEEYIKRFERFAKFPDVVNIKTIKEIPTNYYGVMGVPLTYLKFHDPDVYKIHGQNGFETGNTHALYVEGKSEDECEFGRFFIQRIQ